MAGKRAALEPGFVATVEETGKLARAERFELQAVLRGLLFENRRIRGCLLYRRDTANSVDIRRSSLSGLGYYSGLQTCGRGALCPCCGSKIAEHNCREIQAALDVWRGRGGVAGLLTFTMPHYRSQRLSDNLSAILMAYRELDRNRPYRGLCKAVGLQHTIRALEVTWGRLNGWHPHLHILAFFSDRFVAAQFAGELAELWLANLHRQGVEMKDREAVLERGVRVDVGISAGAQYLSKVGRSWGLAEEVAKANRKRGRGDHYSPVDLLRHVRDSTLPEAGAVFREYAAAADGRHFLRWSAHMRRDLGLLPEKSDEEVAAGVDQLDPFLARLDALTWRAVRFAGGRARVRLLELAEQDEDSALAYVAHLVGRYAESASVGGAL
jgi:hypothetical protein